MAFGGGHGVAGSRTATVLAIDPRRPRLAGGRRAAAGHLRRGAIVVAGGRTSTGPLAAVFTLHTVSAP
jgi:hypothetical protein